MGTKILGGEQSFVDEDARTTVKELRDWVRRFVCQRGWQTFHTPKNLAMSVAIEAAELMEHFQWINVDQSSSLVADPKQLSEICDELADVLCYVLAMANSLEIDLTTALRNKMEKNARKYPVNSACMENSDHASPTRLPCTEPRR